MEILKDFCQALVGVATDVFHMLANNWNDGLLGKCIAIMLAIMAIAAIVLVLVLIVALLIGLFSAADSWFRPRQRNRGRIIWKKFTPAHTTSSVRYDVVLKMVLPTTVHHPDKWEVGLLIDDQEVSMSVEQQIYDVVTQNQWVTVECVCGRFSGVYYPKELSTVAL